MASVVGVRGFAHTHNWLRTTIEGWFCLRAKSPEPLLEDGDDEVEMVTVGAKVERETSGSLSQVTSLQGDDFLLAIVLAICYGSFMYCRMFFSVCSDAIRREPGMNIATLDITVLIVVSAVAFGVGKVVAGVLLDRFDARSGLYLSMLLTSVLVLIFSSCTSYNQMMFVSVLNSLPQAAGYPAVAKLAYEYFDPQVYGKAFSIISVGSRMGSLTSSLVLGAAIGNFGWRGSVRMAPCMTLIALAITYLVLRRAKPAIITGRHPSKDKSSDIQCSDEKDQASAEGIGSKFRRVLTNKQWWVVNLGSSFLLVSKGFEAYCAVYLGDILKLSPSASGMIIATIPGGIVASLLVGGSCMELLPLRRKAILTVALCVLNFFSLMSLSIVTWAIELRGTGGSPDMVLALFGAENPGPAPPVLATLVGVLLFSIGFGAGYPFYIPQSIFALELGGKDSAMVVGCGELMQALVGATFALSGGKMAEAWGWRYTLAMLAGGAAASVVCMCVFFASRLKNGNVGKSV